MREREQSALNEKEKEKTNQKKAPGGHRMAKGQAGGDPHVPVRDGVQSANEKEKNTNQLVAVSCLVFVSRRAQQAFHSQQALCTCERREQSA